MNVKFFLNVDQGGDQGTVFSLKNLNRLQDFLHEKDFCGKVMIRHHIFDRVGVCNLLKHSTL